MCVPYVLQPRAGSMNPDAIKSLKNNKQKQKRLVSSRSNRESEWGLVRGWGRHILYKLVADSVMCSMTPETSKWSCEETRKFCPKLNILAVSDTLVGKCHKTGTSIRRKKMGLSRGSGRRVLLGWLSFKIQESHILGISISSICNILASEFFYEVSKKSLL